MNFISKITITISPKLKQKFQTFVGFFIFEQKAKHMKLLKEFKDFAVKGNMMDMAIGIIIGASFNAIVNVLVKNIILPPLSLSNYLEYFLDKRID